MSLSSNHPIYNFEEYDKKYKTPAELKSLCLELERAIDDSLEDQYRLARAQFWLFLNLKDSKNLNIAGDRMTSLSKQINGIDTVSDSEHVAEQKLRYAHSAQLKPEETDCVRISFDLNGEHYELPYSTTEERRYAFNLIYRNGRGEMIRTIQYMSNGTAYEVHVPTPVRKCAPDGYNAKTVSKL